MEKRLEVRLTGGPPWGFRLRGGAGTGLPLTVHKVRRHSKAYRRLREGDRIVCVNGRPCDGLTYDQLMDVADAGGPQLDLRILRRESDDENRVEEKNKMSATCCETTDVKDAFTPEDVPKMAAVKPVPASKELQSSQQQKESHFTKAADESLLHGLPDITMDTIDLNNLIAETQKRLDSFRNNWSHSSTPTDLDGRRPPEDVPKESGSLKSVPPAKPDTLSDASQDSCREVEPAPSLPDVGLESQSSSENFKIPPNTFVQEEPAPSLPDIGLASQPSSENLKIQPDSFVKEEPAPSLPDIGFPSQSSSETFKMPPVSFVQEEPPPSLPDIGFTIQSSEVTTVTPLGTEIKKKKMFSSSSFYEEPHSMYPTLEEQVEMARKIADSLADDHNRKSKGANMFYKRLTRSNDWVHEGPEPTNEPGPEVPFRPAKGLKLVLDPRHPLDLAALRSSGYVISEHNVVSPEVCHGLVKDLQSPTGRGAALFAKRKKKSEEWVVDEERVKSMLRERKSPILPPLTQSPFGFGSSILPDQLAETVIKRAESLSRESSLMEGCVSPPAYDVYHAKPPAYDVYHAKPPRGWEGGAVGISQHVASSVPQQQSRNVHNGFQMSKKMVFQNFNAVPRLWKGTSVH